MAGVPGPHDEGEFQGIAEPKKRAFLGAYVQSGTVIGAARAVPMSPRMHYYWLEWDAVYADAFKRARELAVQYLEQVAINRAIVGSDLLLIFLLKAARPEKYRDQVDVNITLRSKIERMASDAGLEIGEVMAEADRILAARR